MEISYQLFEDESLLVQKYSGIFSFEKYFEYTSYLTEFYALKIIRKVLIDFRELSFSDLSSVNPDDFSDNIERIVVFRKNIDKKALKNKNVTLVIWVDKPIPTVIAHLFTSRFADKKYHYCSTEENILRILSLPEHLTKLESVSRNLENKYIVN